MEYVKPVEVNDVRTLLERAEDRGYMLHTEAEQIKNYFTDRTKDSKYVCGTLVNIDMSICNGALSQYALDFINKFEQREDKMLESLLRFKSCVIEVLCRLETVSYANFSDDAWRVGKKKINEKIKELFSFSLNATNANNRRLQLLKVCKKVVTSFQDRYEGFFLECYPNTSGLWLADNDNWREFNDKYRKFVGDYAKYRLFTYDHNLFLGGGNLFYTRNITVQ